MEIEGRNIECCTGVVFPPAKVYMVTSCAFCGPAHDDRWSFGGNRLQVKVEARLMAEVDSALRGVESVGLRTTGAFRSLAGKQDLLLLLLDNEKMRLDVWLYPLGHERRPFFYLSKTHPDVSRPELHGLESNARITQGNISKYSNTAWLENPSLAIQLCARFQSPRLRDDVRSLLSIYPERALDEPDALQILLGPSLEADMTSQLKVITAARKRLDADYGSTCFTGLR